LRLKIFLEKVNKLFKRDRGILPNVACLTAAAASERCGSKTFVRKKRLVWVLATCWRYCQQFMTHRLEYPNDAL